MQGSFSGGAPIILITENMERIVLPSSMMGALRRARNFGRRAGSLSANHPLNAVVENAVTIPGAVSLAPAPQEKPCPLFADAKPTNGKVGDSEQCPICLGKWSETDDEIVLSQCAHAFHKGCIREWVQPPGRTKADQNRDLCPICRSQL